MPDYLDEIIGQETAKRFLRTAVKKENLYNFLLTGPRGVGKRLLSFALAKTLNCLPDSANFILVAPIPSKIKDKEAKIFEYTKHYLPENTVVELEDRTAILIEQIRIVIKRLIHMPDIGSKRVVLVLEADRMTDAAANCFLKTLEEPPLDTVFILTSSRPNSLLPTIRSRCQAVPLSYLNNQQIKNILFECNDEFLIGSPGEILLLQEHDLVSQASGIFKNCPLDTETAAATAKEYERKKIIDLLYPLLLMYRLVLYKKLNIVLKSTIDDAVNKKANNISLDKIISTLGMLNNNINILEQNPNRLLLLFNLLTKLP
ncbi:AAA family ATPase [candidate division WOR-3 bacterium]|nr:AAA family ATPase [candidate division WOR-3 bacterium]